MPRWWATMGVSMSFNRTEDAEMMKRKHWRYLELSVFIDRSKRGNVDSPCGLFAKERGASCTVVLAPRSASSRVALIPVKGLQVYQEGLQSCVRPIGMI